MKVDTFAGTGSKCNIKTSKLHRPYLGFLIWCIQIVFLVKFCLRSPRFGLCTTLGFTASGQWSNFIYKLVISPGVARGTPRYMKVGTFDEKMFPSSRAVLGNIFSYKCVPFHVYIFSFLFNVVWGSRIPVPANVSTFIYLFQPDEEPLKSKAITQTCQTRRKSLAATVSNKFVKKEKSNLTVTKERLKKEDHLSTIFMGYVLVFLVCHTPRLVLSFYELTAIRSALECNK